MSTRPTPAERAAVMTCDALLPDASIVMDRATSLPAPPPQVWPWLVQLGKDRAGWYLPRPVERWIPPSRRALRHLEPRFLDHAVGDVIPDWGPGDPTFTLAVLESNRVIGYTSTRGNSEVTWELSLAPAGTGTRLHLRLRIARHRDWRTPLLQHLGGAFDWLTVLAMFAGLRERLIAAKGHA